MNLKPETKMKQLYGVQLDKYTVMDTKQLTSKLTELGINDCQLIINKVQKDGKAEIENGIIYYNHHTRSRRHGSQQTYKCNLYK